MGVVLVGANPGLLLYDDDEPTAAVSVWTVDWSVWGVGSVLVVADRDGWLTVGADEHLARILLERFTRHFPEFAAFTGDPAGRSIRHVDDRVTVSSDLFSGLRATGGGVAVRIGGVKDRRQYSQPDFPLGELTMGLTNVYLPCELGELTIDGTPVAGAPRCRLVDGRWTSSSFLAVAEVWTRTEPVQRSASDPVAATTDRRTRRHLHAISP